MIEICISILSGIISSLGMGGGSILIIVLINILKIDQRVAQATNLIFFIPTAITATIINIKNKKINFKISMKFIIFGILGTIIGSMINLKINNEILKKIFGIFLILMGIYEIYYWYKKHIKRNNNKRNINFKIKKGG